MPLATISYMQGCWDEVENITFLATRNGQFEPNPPGTGLFTNSKLNAYEIYTADTWRIKPSLTLSYGLLYSWQVPPVEEDKKQTLLVFADTEAIGESEKLPASEIRSGIARHSI